MGLPFLIPVAESHKLTNGHAAQDMPYSLISAFETYHAKYLAEPDDEKLVYVATRTIEDLLTRVLQKFFLKDTEGDLLFGAKMLLEPFHAKITTAERLGLISKGLADELRLLRVIRKEFRQKIDCYSLEYKEVRIFCANLKAPSHLRNQSSYAKEKFPPTARGNFELAVTILSCLLEDVLHQTREIAHRPLH